MPDPRREARPPSDPGWLHDQVAKSVASLDSLPPKLRAALAQPTTRRRHHVITHPTTEMLLAEHGNTAQGRRNARRALRSHIVAEAHREAGLAGLSIRCRASDCRRMENGGYSAGCANDGSTCICECHDPKETP